MKIGIDARVLERNMSGIGRYLNGILIGLKKFDIDNEYYLFTYKELKSVDSRFKIIPTFQNLNPNKIISSAWLNFIAPGKILENKIDLFFSPNNFLPKLRGNEIAVSTIHDTVHKINRKFHPFSYRLYKDLILPKTIKRSNVIITVSENSKNDLIKFYNVDENKLRVIPQYIDDKFTEISKSDGYFNHVVEKYGLAKDVILYMGAIENRKNIYGILKIADLLKDKITNEFLLIGKNGYGSDDILEQIKKRTNVRYIEYVDESDVQYIYNAAKIFLFPSFYEGFGLPPLEAMKSGIPTVASNNSSLKEVLDGGAVLLEQTDYHSFAEEILKLINRPEYYNKIKHMGIEKAQNYNLKNTTKKVVEMFNEFNR